MKLNIVRNLFVALVAMLLLSSFARAFDFCYYKVGDTYVANNSVAYAVFSPTGEQKIVLAVVSRSEGPLVVRFNTPGPTVQDHKAQFNKVMNQCRDRNLPASASPFN